MPPRKLLEKPCHRCEQVFPREEYAYRNKKKDQRVQFCRPCLSAVQKARRATPEIRAKAAAYKRSRYSPEEGHRQKIARYGLTQEAYDEMLKEQGGVCAICKTVREWRGRLTLHIDHDHETGQVRGLLCQWCNTGIGSLGDNTDRLYSAIKYLKTYDMVIQEKVSRLTS